MNIEYSWSKSKYIWLRRLYFKYAFARDKVFYLILVLFKIIFFFLPLRLLTNIKSSLKLTYLMPYKYIIKIDINVAREIGRGSFPGREPDTVAWTEDCAKNGGVFYDIGANIGAVSLIYAANIKNNNATGSVYAFEPMPINFERLFTNIYNNFPGRIKAFLMPISDKYKMGEMSIGSINPGSSGHYLEGGGGSFTCVVYSLDYLHYQLGFEVPDYLKIDVDGNDYNVLLGAERLIKNGHVKSVLIEKNDSENDIQKFMKKYNYKEKKINSNINLCFYR